MISVFEVVADVDMVQPEPWTIQRSTGQWVAGGLQSTITRNIQVFGPARVAQNKEVQSLPEADRVGRILAFYATQPILTTRGYAPVPCTHGETPAGAIPGTTYTLSEAPPVGGGMLYVNGLALQVPTGYTLNDLTITLAVATPAEASIYFTWPITANAEAAESDIILYEGFQYRVLSVYRTAGAGYWKALGTRLEAA
jgi:hypothetical protein